MKKLLITTALLFTALPFTFDGVKPAISKAHARIGRPFTPLSFAGDASPCRATNVRRRR